MAKSLACRRTFEGLTVKEHTVDYFHQRAYQAEKQYGRYSPEAWEARVIPAAIHCAVEEYENVEPLLTGYAVAEQGKEAPNPMGMFWARTLLAEAYCKLNRISEAMRITNQDKSLASGLDPSAGNPLLGSLLEQATALEAKGDLKSRQCGFVVGLVALCWSISHGFQRTPFGSAFLERLCLFFDCYGIRGDEWEWTVKHSHLTRYDFVGLLSILLHHTGLGLGPRPLTVAPKRPRRPRIIEVR
jgi:hypothetical protein